MEHLDSIGQGRIGARPYEIAVRWDDASPCAPCVLCMSEGSGHASWACSLALSDVLGPAWAEHLTICDCQWLRDLASQQPSPGRLWSGPEVVAEAETRGKQRAQEARAARSRRR